MGRGRGYTGICGGLPARGVWGTHIGEFMGPDFFSLDRAMERQVTNAVQG